MNSFERVRRIAGQGKASVVSERHEQRLVGRRVAGGGDQRQGTVAKNVESVVVIPLGRSEASQIARKESARSRDTRAGVIELAGAHQLSGTGPGVIASRVVEVEM